MKYLIEFSRSKSDSYRWAVRQCKKLPGYRETLEDGMIIHAVEFDDIETFVPIQRLVGGWRNTAYFRDGKPIPVDFLWEEYLHKYPPHGSLDMMRSAAAEDAKRPASGPGSVIIDLDSPIPNNVKSLPAPKKHR